MLVGWGILSPLAKYKGWAPGAVGMSNPLPFSKTKYYLTPRWYDFSASMQDGARGWILWVALAIMSAESVISLVPVALELVRSIQRIGTSPQPSAEDSGEQDIEPEERLVPIKWVLYGIGTSLLGGTSLVWFVFGSEGIKPWATVLGFALGAVLSLLG